MTRDEAIEIVGMIVNSWPGPAWEAGRLEAYVTAIVPLDPAVTTLAVARAVKVLKYRPSIAELREFVRIERALSEEEEVRYMPVESPGKPAWVERWERARAAGDFRCFPEQINALDTLARQGVENYKVYAPPTTPISDATEWVQAHEYTDLMSASDAIV